MGMAGACGFMGVQHVERGGVFDIAAIAKRPHTHEFLQSLFHQCAMMQASVWCAHPGNLQFAADAAGHHRHDWPDPVYVHNVGSFERSAE